ncbi:ribokinase [Candidatus Leptofilum sp.]|uniref:ribokinase n=1 Tax=Candidatus Leptofilum sp. TaxID=3241576 RepID=UPI003B5C1260
MAVVVLGSINMDLTTYVPRLPAPGETLFGSSFITVPGGKGFNQAVAAGRLGAPTQFIGRVGDDAFGKGVLELVADEPVDISGILVDPDSGTGLAVISVDEAAENAIIVISGANMTHDGREVARTREALQSANVLLLQMESPLETSLAAAQAAQDTGATVIFDPAPAKPLPAEAYQLCHVMTPNELETEVLVGFRPANQTEAAKAAEILLERGVDTAVIKLGAQGVYYQSAAESGFVEPFTVNAIDTVAAGDAFNGGLAVALAEERPLPEAIRWGAAAGALATTKPGASSAMPTRAELEQLLKK